MNFKALLLLVVVGLAACQVQKRIIDDFLVDTNTLIILIDTDLLPQTLVGSTQDPNILGGERDLSVTAETGLDNNVLTAGVSGGLWAVSTPNGASGFAVMQYDGLDNSPVLNPVGLGSIDITADSAFAFQLVVQTDIDTEYTIDLFSVGGGSGSAILEVPGGNTAVQFLVLYTDFDGNVDFTAISAIQITVECHENVDALLLTFTTWGPSTPSQTATPAPPAFTASKSPNPYVSWYTFDDDDEGISPCGDEGDRRTYFLEDGDIVYYYFYGFPDPEPVLISVNSGSLLASGLISLLALFVL